MTTSPLSARHAKRHPLETLGRVGYAAKGVVYVLLGVLAADAAFGSGGGPEGQTGALQSLAGTSYGPFILWALVVGLTAYGLWRFALAALDPEQEGDDAEGLVKRAGYVVSGVAYLGLAYTAYQIVSGAGAGSGGATEERTASVLALPGGRWIVGAAAVVVFGYGLYEFVRAYKASFMEHLDLEGAAARNRDKVRLAGRAGLAARGVVYVIIGTFLGQAALQQDAEEAGGLDAALTALQDQSYGPWLLGLVAIGLVLYGLYCGVNALYRRYPAQ